MDVNIKLFWTTSHEITVKVLFLNIVKLLYGGQPEAKIGR